MLHNCYIHIKPFHHELKMKNKISCTSFLGSLFFFCTIVIASLGVTSITLSDSALSAPVLATPMPSVANTEKQTAQELSLDSKEAHIWSRIGLAVRNLRFSVSRIEARPPVETPRLAANQKEWDDNLRTPGTARNKIGLVVWGNYCGLGNKSPNYEEPPVDEIDQICMEHDKCYDERGRFDCVCDEIIASESRELYEFFKRRNKRRKAYFSRLIWLAFKNNTCDEE